MASDCGVCPPAWQERGVSCHGSDRNLRRESSQPFKRCGWVGKGNERSATLEPKMAMVCGTREYERMCMATYCSH
eukprot:8933827-Heterocapsa_arctica.AAC.1